MKSKNALLKATGIASFAALFIAFPALAQYQKGQVVDYKEGEYSPWQTGTVEEMTPSGKQVIVRSKPREFYPNGDTRAIDLDKIRPSTGGAPNAAAQHQQASANTQDGTNFRPFSRCSKNRAYFLPFAIKERQFN